MKQKVLIVDDDLVIQKLLSKVMLNNGIDPFTAGSGEDALAMVRHETFDLILMDINMGKMDGFETLQEIRNRGSHVPIIIISARIEDYDALYGFGIGADDYITKPFNPILLGARVKALIRRDKYSSFNNKSSIFVGPFRYNMVTMKFYKGDEEIFLSSKENTMIKFFLTHINRVFTKDQLYEQIWGDNVVDENAIMVYINRLRNKIEEDPKKPEYIQTVWGIGYKFTIS